jgi:hypothetical protein
LKFTARLIVLAGLFFISSRTCKAQNADTLATWSLSAYADVYYARYSDSAGPNQFQKFPTISPRSNSFGINIVQLTAQYDGPKIRALAIFHAGDIPVCAWDSTFRFIQEAHVGVKLCNKLWLDAGFFKTHFGTEFLDPKDNITSSVSVNTYYEPYYESGFRLNYDPAKKLEINLFVLNGYNMFIDNNRQKSLGLGVTYALGDNGGAGYTNYLGDDAPIGDSLPRFRFHNNAFFNYQAKKFKIQVGADYCFQQNSDITTHHKTATMYSGIATLKYQALPKFGVYARGEVFNDPDAIMSTLIKDKAGQFTGYKLWGATAGVEYKPSDNSYIRLEGRRLEMDGNQDIFLENGTDTNVRLEIMLNMGVFFDLLKGSEVRNNLKSN